MKSEAEKLFDRLVAGIPEGHLVLTYDQAKKAVEKKMTSISPESIQKIIRDEAVEYDSLEEAVEAIKLAEECSGTEAMSRAARRYPELLRKYNQEGLEHADKAKQGLTKGRGPSREQQKFDLLVAGIAEREGVSRHVAMDRARRRRPRLFELAYPRE